VPGPRLPGRRKAIDAAVDGDARHCERRGAGRGRGLLDGRGARLSASQSSQGLWRPPAESGPWAEPDDDLDSTGLPISECDIRSWTWIDYAAEADVVYMLAEMGERYRCHHLFMLGWVAVPYNRDFVIIYSRFLSLVEECGQGCAH
jgi:hypothetical protein